MSPIQKTEKKNAQSASEPRKRTTTAFFHFPWITSVLCVPMLIGHAAELAGIVWLRCQLRIRTCMTSRNSLPALLQSAPTSQNTRLKSARSPVSFTFLRPRIHRDFYLVRQLRASNCLFRAGVRLSEPLITLSLILVGSLLGCSEPAVSRDGSVGTLKFGTQTPRDICVVVHRKDGTGFQEQGFGTTDGTGLFFLLKSGGQEALVLEPGEYSFTLESVGPQITFPPDYLLPGKSPLKVTWAADMKSLELNAPEPLLKAPQM